VEGFAMLRAAARDLSSEADVAAALHPDRPALAVANVRRLPPDEVWKRTFDAVLPIAPEIDGVAERLSRRFEATGVRLLAPSADFVAWAADKTNYSASVSEFQADDMVVIKPADGVGGMFTLKGRAERLEAMTAYVRRRGCRSRLLVQPYYSGRSVSVAVLARGRERPVVLPTVRQVILERSVPELPEVAALVYAGGIAPILDDGRAERLAVRTLGDRCEFGYFGVDLILDPTDPNRDIVVDVNPRLTTSYLAYSRLAPSALARLLLGTESAQDRRAVERLKANVATTRAIRFYPDGTVSDSTA
jgi:predicted ATP-grasp superfamily ATP-dependent carboligase